jgi:hypothetical protein
MKRRRSTATIQSGKEEEEVLPQYRVEKKKKKYCHNPEWKRRRRSTATIQSGKEEEEVLPQSGWKRIKINTCMI